MPKKKEEKDDRMIAEYFNNLENYKKMYGRKTILLWQCGSFYEIYSMQNPETKEHLSEEFNDFLNITHMNSAAKNLNYKKNGITYPVKMAGFTASDYYLEKYSTILVNEGFTVPVWYEAGSCGKKKIRKELHIFSPGTNFNVKESNKESNTIACYSIIKNDKGFLNKNPSVNMGCACVDIFTGSVKVFQHEVSRQNIHTPNVFDELERFNSIYKPNETIILHNYGELNKIENIIQFSSLQTKSIHIIDCDGDEEQNKLANKCEEQTYQKKIILDFYDIPDYDAFLETSQLILYPNALKSLCFLLDFIFQHNPNLTHKLHLPDFDNITNRLFCGNHSLIQLNITNNSNVRGQFSSVERLLNKCVTPMGRRYFKDKILHPVTDIKYLNTQYNMIDHFINNFDKYQSLRKTFISIKDIEHLYRKIIFNKVSPYDFYLFVQNLHTILNVNDLVKKDKKIKKYINDNISENIEITCKKLLDVLEKNLNMKVCETLVSNKFEINFFNRNVNNLLDKTSDEFDSVKTNLDGVIKEFGEIITGRDSKAKDPIKLHKTEKSGLYLYATNKRCKILETALNDKVNINESMYDNNNVKFTTGSANGSSNKKIMGSAMTKLYNSFIQKQSNLSEVLKNVYAIFVRSLISFDNEMNNFVQYISHLDMLVTKAYISKKYNYCKPIIKEKATRSFFSVKEIRHPIIEQLLMQNGNEIYVPNDVKLGKSKHGMIIFGTNGVGKSSINRSVGISIIMAQSGMFVPSTEFVYKPYQSIYTRILGNDNIFKGLSTFAVEMCELATILNNCDENSLILGDEVCSGTESSSAVSIFAQTLIELQETKATHIFATHFHEILKMSEINKLKKLDVKHMSVRCDGEGTLYYTRKLEDGPGADMYGLEVCKSFHFKQDFLHKAHMLRTKYDKTKQSKLKSKKTKYNAKKLKGKCEFCEKEGVDIHHLEPQEKANVNNYIQTFHKNHAANLVNICKKCHINFTKKNIIHRKTKTTKGYEFIEKNA